jgi:peptidoglycan hydrolase-like protein with peptidoglycan-binding domain
MTHALIARTWDESAHTRAPSGQSGGGEFAGQGQKSAERSANRRRSTGQRGHAGVAKGQYGYDGSNGSGYGVKGGDANVKQLQGELNRLGFTDGAGKKLAEDGKFGPKTTGAVKTAQKRLGMKPTGIITQSFIDRLKATKMLPKAMPKAPVHAAADPSKPYGDVTYADPGYQPDGKKRYPLSDEKTCRAAWSYIHQEKNRKFYTAEQLKAIEGRIKAAGKKYGITFADEVKAAASPDLHGVELARPGPWKVASGNGEFTPEMLRDAADFFTVSGGQAVPVKLGHTDDRFAGDGDPTFGSVTNVRYVEDERGPVLLGDITGMPGWLAASAPKRWPNRSIEGWQDFTYEGREYSLVLTALAFLGVTPPAVRNIRSLSDLQTALAASARRLVASAPDDDPAEPPQTPAPEAEEPREGTGMDPVKIREALGLDPDASDDEVKAVMLTAAGAISDESPPEPAQPALFEDTTAPAAQPAPKKELVHAAGAPGTVVLASSVWDETQNTIKKLQQFVDKTQRDERDQVIAKAVIDGKFTPAQRTHFSRLWDADPTGTRALIDNLTRNSALAVMASGYVGEGDEDIDKEYAHLFPPQAKESSRG